MLLWASLRSVLLLAKAARIQPNMAHHHFVSSKIQQKDVLVMFSKTYCPFVQQAGRCASCWKMSVAAGDDFASHFLYQAHNCTCSMATPLRPSRS